MIRSVYESLVSSWSQVFFQFSDPLIVDGFIIDSYIMTKIYFYFGLCAEPIPAIQVKSELGWKS